MENDWLNAPTIVCPNGTKPSLRGEGRRDATSCDVQQALTRSGIFRKTDPEVASSYSKQVKVAEFQPGCVVDADSEPGGQLYVIISGKAKVSYQRLDGCEVVLKLLGPSGVYGVTAMFDPTSRRVCATTLTVAQAVLISRDQLMMWMATHPEVGDQILRLIARQWRAATNALVDLSCVQPDARVASRLLCLSKQFGWRDGDVLKVTHDLTLEDFALLVGASPASVTAALRDFEHRGWIRLENNGIAIADGEALSRKRAANTSEA